MYSPLRTPDYNAIRVLLVNAVKTSTGLDQNHVIMMEPEIADSPRPTLPYIALKITIPGKRYGDDVISDNEDGSMNSGGPRGMWVRFVSYARTHEDAYDLMALLQASLDVENIQLPLRAGGVSVWVIGDVKDMSLLLNAGYEGRAEMVTSFGLASNLNLMVQNIESVNIEGNIDTDNGIEHLTFAVTGD